MQFELATQLKLLEILFSNHAPYVWNHCRWALWSFSLVQPCCFFCSPVFSDSFWHLQLYILLHQPVGYSSMEPMTESEFCWISSSPNARRRASASSPVPPLLLAFLHLAHFFVPFFLQHNFFGCNCPPPSNIFQHASSPGNIRKSSLASPVSGKVLEREGNGKIEQKSSKVFQNFRLNNENTWKDGSYFFLPFVH